MNKGHAIALITLFSCVGLVGSPSTAKAINLSDLAINGFFDIEYEIADGPGNPPLEAPAGDEKGSFDQHHYNILMNMPVSLALTIKGHIEYEHGPQSPAGEVTLEWSYLEYLLNNNISFRAGLMLTPFGLYNEIHDATPTYLSIRIPGSIYKTRSVGALANADLFPKFSTGLFVRGRNVWESDMQLNYAVYVANGENFSKHEAEFDENSNKSVGGQLMFSPLPGMSVGGGYYTGRKQTSLTTQVDHTAWIGSAEYLLHPIGIRAEYASATIGTTTQNGWYGEGSYAIDEFTPFLRYGQFDPDDQAANDQWTELVAGTAYRIEDNFVLKLEYRRFGGEANNLKVEDNYNEYGAALTVSF